MSLLAKASLTAEHQGVAVFCQQLGSNIFNNFARIFQKLSYF